MMKASNQQKLQHSLTERLMKSVDFIKSFIDSIQMIAIRCSKFKSSFTMLKTGTHREADRERERQRNREHNEALSSHFHKSDLRDSELSSN